MGDIRGESGSIFLDMTKGGLVGRPLQVPSTRLRRALRARAFPAHAPPRTVLLGVGATVAEILDAAVLEPLRDSGAGLLFADIPLFHEVGDHFFNGKLCQVFLSL